MEKLIIETVNKLQAVFKTAGQEGGIDLPEIVVVGEQSAGKSSVLESIVGRPCLPRGTGIVTRCPIVIQLIRIEPKSGTSNGQNGEPEEWVEFLDLTSTRNVPQRITQFDTIPGIIQDEVAKRAGKDQFIVDRKLVMRIYSPKVINLTLVDLPGIVKVATEGQPDSLPNQVEKLLHQYTKNPRSIILAVSPATSDIATSASIEFARTVDPNLDRTIAVITKLDLMDAGTDARDVLNGKLLKMKLGIVGVVNRSYEDIQQRRTIEDHLEKEKRFFRKHYRDIAATQGTLYLRTRLQSILMEKIQIALVPLENQISRLLLDEEEKLKSLGNDVHSDKQKIMINTVERFCRAYSAAMDGETHNISDVEMASSRNITAEFEDKFPRSIEKINPMNDLTDAMIRVKINNSASLEASQLPLERVYQDLARGQIRKLETPALYLAERIRNEVLRIVDECLGRFDPTFARFPNLRKAILEKVKEMLEKQTTDARKMLKDYVQNQASFIVTGHGEFKSFAKDIMTNYCVFFKNDVSAPIVPSTSAGTKLGFPPSNPKANTESAIESVRTLVKAYVDLVKRPYLDYCPKVLVNVVIFYLQENMHDTLISELINNIKTVMQESPAIAGMRLRSLEKIEELRQAKAIILEVLEIQSSKV